MQVKNNREFWVHFKSGRFELLLQIEVKKVGRVSQVCSLSWNGTNLFHFCKQYCQRFIMVSVLRKKVLK